MSIFDNLDQATVFENSVYFQPGTYIVEINACKFVQGYKGESFVIESKVLGVNSDESDAPKVGQIAAQVWNASGDKREIARATWLGFLCAVFQVKKEDYNGEQWKNISAEVIDDNKLKGMKLFVSVFMKKTKAGGDFTQHRWSVPTQEQLAEHGVE